MTVNQTATIPHIEYDDRGVAWVIGANTKVIEVALSHLAYGFSPEEIHFQYPHLSMGQIHAALMHYWDNQAAYDEKIRQQVETADQLAAANFDSPGRQRVRAIRAQQRIKEGTTESTE